MRGYLSSPKLTYPLRMDGWKTSFLLGWPIFRCYVNFREGSISSGERRISEPSKIPSSEVLAVCSGAHPCSFPTRAQAASPPRNAKKANFSGKFWLKVAKCSDFQCVIQAIFIFKKLTGSGFKYVFYVHLYLGPWSNHQLPATQMTRLFWLEFGPCFGGWKTTKIEAKQVPGRYIIYLGTPKPWKIKVLTNMGCNPEKWRFLVPMVLNISEQTIATKLPPVGKTPKWRRFFFVGEIPPQWPKTSRLRIYHKLPRSVCIYIYIFLYVYIYICVFFLYLIYIYVFIHEIISYLYIILIICHMHNIFWSCQCIKDFHWRIAYQISWDCVICGM